MAELWQQPDHWLEGQGRLTHPLRYDAKTDHYVPVEWGDAIADIGARMRALDHPAQAEFLHLRARFERGRLPLPVVRARVFGTNNFPDCSNMCHEPTSVGLPRSIGTGKGTVGLDDFDVADLILSFGHNPGTNHPRMMTSPAQRIQARRHNHRLQPVQGTRARTLPGAAGAGRDGDHDVAADRDRLLAGQGRR